MPNYPFKWVTDKHKNKCYAIAHINSVRDDNGNPLSQYLGGKALSFGTCSTAAATAAKDVTIADFELATDSTIVVKFTNGISVASATLSVNSGTAVPIYYRGAALGSNIVKTGESVILNYNGTQLDIIGDFTPSGFLLSSDETTGYDEFNAVGNATITEDDTNGYDEFDF